MTAAPRLCAVAACLLAGLPAQRLVAPRGFPACLPLVRVVVHLPERIDSLLAVGSGGAAVALGSPSRLGLRFLPHDNLLLLTRARARRVALPPYVTPPGLAAATGSPARVYVVVDSTLWLLDAATGRVQARRPLDVQAVGWPAAVAAAPTGRLYLVGQRPNEPAATLEALAVDPAGRTRLLWRSALGLTHAGIWLGLAGRGRLAVYIPNAYDERGAIALLAARSGALRRTYDVPVPPLAADPVRDRLYLDDAGTIRALTLSHGVPVAAVAGAGPLALDLPYGLVAFTHGDGVVLASARTLRPLAHIVLTGITALATSPDGRTLLAGGHGDVVWVNLGACTAR